MSYKEALEDGIRMGKDKDGFDCYFPHCHICGAEVQSWSYIPTNTYTCRDCRRELIRLAKEEFKVGLSDLNSRQRKLKRAISRINRNFNIDAYDAAIQKAKDTINNDDWFGSTEEVMVALQLWKKGVRFIPQYKVGKYTCDFYLPDDGVVIEIDGELYHTKDKQEKEEYRDWFIEKELGLKTHVIRVKASLINENVTRITPAIDIFKKRDSGENYEKQLEKIKKWKRPWKIEIH